MSDPEDPSSQRDFLKRSAWGTGFAGLAVLPDAGADASSNGHSPASTAAAPRYDFTQGSGALQPDAVVTSACQCCNSLCRLNVHLKGGRIDEVIVESPRGAVRGTALLWEGIREDTFFVPNTFGPRQQMGEDAGVPAYPPANLLLDDRYYDNLSGQQAYKCFACRISKVTPEAR